MKGLLIHIVLTLLWVAITGVLTYGNTIVGAIVMFVVVWWLQPLTGSQSYCRKLVLYVWYGLLFLIEILKSNVRVAWDVITPRKYRRPGMVAIPLDVETDIEITVLSTMITLTPGSLFIDLSPDRKIMYVHVMFIDDLEAVRHEIKSRFERWVITLLR